MNIKPVVPVACDCIAYCTKCSTKCRIGMNSPTVYADLHARYGTYYCGDCAAELQDTPEPFTSPSREA